MNWRIVFCFIITTCILNIGHAQNFLNEEVLMQLISVEDSSIKRMDENKCYVTPERISLSHEGLFLHSEFFGSIPLRSLQQEVSGEVYVLRRSNGYWYVCNDCGKEYSSKPSSCERCGGTSFRTEGVD